MSGWLWLQNRRSWMREETHGQAEGKAALATTPTKHTGSPSPKNPLLLEALGPVLRGQLDVHLSLPPSKRWRPGITNYSVCKLKPWLRMVGELGTPLRQTNIPKGMPGRVGTLGLRQGLSRKRGGGQPRKLSDSGVTDYFRAHRTRPETDFPRTNGGWPCIGPLQVKGTMGHFPISRGQAK